MEIRILTYGRHNRQITYENLPMEWKAETKLVVQEREAHLYPRYHTIVLPDHIRNLHQTRQYLLENRKVEKAVELDDDLVFSARREDDPTKFRPMEPVDFDEMFGTIEQMLDSYSLVGVSHREGANRNIDSFLYATRQMRVHAYKTNELLQMGCRWDKLRSPGPEDFCMTLQLLTKGAPNCVLNEWVHNQGGSNNHGGCSSYRTPEVHADACRHLAEMFPSYVKLVRKQTKGSWGGGVRTDVRIQWKKAFQHGLNKQI